MVQTCWSRKATFFILLLSLDVIVQALLVPLRSFFILLLLLLLLLLLSFLVRDHRDSLQVIYFKPRHNVP